MLNFMKKRIKLRHKSIVRPKAIAGALIGSAVIGGITNLIGAAAQSASANANASREADIARRNAELQANAIKEQTQNNNRLQEQMLAFQRQENEKLRRFNTTNQMNLQLQAGLQNEHTRLSNARIQLEEGGVVPNITPFLRGRYELPFEVTDGGGVVPIAQYPEGTLYEIIGNDHDHYHKTKGGKRKSGVGIKFQNKVIEGEGNQNTNLGELMFVTPDNAIMLSKHSNKGFNPAKETLAGMHPLTAAYIQESNKPLDRNARPVERIKAGDGLLGDYTAPTITAFANLLGSGITSLSNRRAGRYLTNAYQNAGRIMGNAYDQLKGIDLDAISASDYRAPHSMAALQLPDVNTATARAAAERSLHRQLNTINKNTISGAAARNRSNLVESNYNDNISAIEAQANNDRNAIIRNNMATLTQVSSDNANRDARSREVYDAYKMDLLKYNNAIRNERILGKAQTAADISLQTANVNSGIRQANAATLTNALNNIAIGYTNTLNEIGTQRHERDIVYAGLTHDNKFNYLMSDLATIKHDKDKAKALFNLIKDNPQYASWIPELKDKYHLN